MKYLGGKRAVILKHHGVIAVGGNLGEALYAAIYMEEAAKRRILRQKPQATLPS